MEVKIIKFFPQKNLLSHYRKKCINIFGHWSHSISHSPLPFPTPIKSRKKLESKLRRKCFKGSIFVFMILSFLRSGLSVLRNSTTFQPKSLQTLSIYQFLSRCTTKIIFRLIHFIILNQLKLHLFLSFLPIKVLICPIFFDFKSMFFPQRK